MAPKIPNSESACLIVFPVECGWTVNVTKLQVAFNDKGEDIIYAPFRLVVSYSK